MELNLMKNYYNTNPEFKEYVDRYAKKHGISVDEALTHKIVKEFYKYLLAI
jgi:hypothetical protein